VRVTYKCIIHGFTSVEMPTIGRTHSLSLVSSVDIYFLCKALHKKYARVDSEMKRKAIENAYVDLVPNEIPRWEEDGELMRWLSTFCK